VPASIDLRPLIAECEVGTAHAVTVFSRGALENLVSLAGEEGARSLARLPLFASHGRIAEEAGRLGLRATAIAGPDDEEMVERLVAYFGANSAR
jgi:uroporphyrinogen-III synthase